MKSFNAGPGEKKENSIFTVGDAVLSIAIVAVAVALGVYLYWGSSGEGAKTAVIMQYGEVVTQIDLDGLTEPVTMELGGDYTTVITAENGRICISSSTCPNQYCVHTGWLTEPGQTAVCLPNRVVVKIEGDSGFDAVSG